MTTITTTSANFSFHRVVNQICQKFSLDSNEKKQISNFITQRMNGEANVEFVAYLPDDAEQMEIQHKDKVIVVAYSSNKNPNTFYVVAKENVKKEENREDTIALVPISDENRYKIVCATVSRVKDQLRTYMNVSIDDVVETQIYNFIVVQHLKGRIGVVFTPELPASGFSSDTRIKVGDYNLDLVFGKNPMANKFVHILWINLMISEEAKHREFIQRRQAKFRKIWAVNKLPEELLEDVLKKVNFEQPITVEVHGIVKNWTRQKRTEEGDMVYFGQTPDPNTGTFIPNRPIGYIKDNHIVMTSPGNLYRLIELE